MERLAGTTETVERRSFISSIPANAVRFAHAVRGHWGAENRLHWRLDVIYREDASRIRKGNAQAIMTAIRHLCVNLLDREPSTLRMAQKRRLRRLERRLPRQGGVCSVINARSPGANPQPRMAGATEDAMLADPGGA